MARKLDIIVLSTIAIICACVLQTESVTTTFKISLSSENSTISDSLTWKVYSGISEKQANIPSSPGIRGLVHEPIPRNVCSPLQPLPNKTWTVLAVVEGYSSCDNHFDIVQNVIEAGYDLIVASDYGSSSSAKRYILKSGFPAVIVSQKYATYLREYVAVENLNGIDFDNGNAVVATVYTVSSYTSVYSLLGVGGGMILVIIIMFTCGRNGVCKFRRDRSTDGFYRLNNSLDRPAHDELTASIRRQMSELHIDPRSQLALGEWTTKRLPTRKYQNGKEKNDTCAICVNDFSDGDNLRVLPCEHVFHSKCVDEWLINHSSLCPLCKQKIPRFTQNTNRQSAERQHFEYGAV